MPVKNPPGYLTKENASRQLVEAIRKVAGVKCEGAFVTHEHPWQAIIKAAKARRCDLIAMASHGRRGLAAVMLGSETTRVLTHSKMPVLVCR